MLRRETPRPHTPLSAPPFNVMGWTLFLLWFQTKSFLTSTQASFECKLVQHWKQRQKYKIGENQKKDVCLIYCYRYHRILLRFQSEISFIFKCPCKLQCNASSQASTPRQERIQDLDMEKVERRRRRNGGAESMGVGYVDESFPSPFGQCHLPRLKTWGVAKCVGYDTIRYTICTGKLTGKLPV